MGRFFRRGRKRGVAPEATATRLHQIDDLPEVDGPDREEPAAPPRPRAARPDVDAPEPDLVEDAVATEPAIPPIVVTPPEPAPDPADGGGPASANGNGVATRAPGAPAHGNGNGNGNGSHVGTLRTAPLHVRDPGANGNGHDPAANGNGAGPPANGATGAPATGNGAGLSNGVGPAVHPVAAEARARSAAASAPPRSRRGAVDEDFFRRDWVPVADPAPGFSRRRIVLSWVFSLLSIEAGAYYMWWRVGTVGDTGVLGWAFYGAELINFVMFALTAALMLVRPRWRSGPPGPPRGTLDVFVTVAGEPVEVVEQTLLAALRIEYPHKTYLLNDGRIARKKNWREIEELAERHGVVCFTRTRGTRGKAGNLNYALARTDGEFVACIDADHRADSDFAHWLLGYLHDESVAFVATPQQFDLKYPDRLGSREPMFYGLVQPAKDRAGVAFSCGNGVIYRREALDEISGFSEWGLVEDLHTSYQLHAAGWNSVYHPIPHTIGETPETAAGFVRQRMLWATDSLRLFFRDNPLRKKGLSWLRRLHYFQTTGGYLAVLAQTLFIVGPAAYLVFGMPVMQPDSPQDYLLHTSIFFVPLICTLIVWTGLRSALKAIQIQMYLAPVYAVACVRAVLGLRSITVTGAASGWRKRLAVMTWPQQVAVVVCAAAVGLAITLPSPGTLIAGFWSAWVIWALITPAGAIRPLFPLYGQLRQLSLIAVGIAAALLITTGPEPVRWEPTGAIAAPRGPAPPTVPPKDDPGLRRALAPASGIYIGAYSEDQPAWERFPALRWGRSNDVSPAIYHWYQHWEGGETDFQAGWAKSAARSGAIPMVTWEPWNKPPGSVHSANQPRFTLRSISRGDHDEYIREWARDVAEYRGPILLRTMHEMNGNWYPWSVHVNGNRPEHYVPAWRHIHDIFRQEGATNVSWVWTVNPFYKLSWTDQNGRRVDYTDDAGGARADKARISRFYPGDAYVDWTSFTAFNWAGMTSTSSWREPNSVIDRVYAALELFDKPMMVSEIATAGPLDERQRWMDRFFRELPERHPQIKGVVWFDSTYPGDLGEVDFRLKGGKWGDLSRHDRGATTFAAPRIVRVGT